ncbi:peptidoglycan DD-metalloendopeptidase family protein [Rubrobacter marinus]|uniref:Peptidoglycan DD-metalloendopeptidase family protein n=1 Tax=Rubrobacter marinus TaxID=2653852 RepID=A0A6G8PUR3_9ACTN|nr:M23 family metallopeptidase [Rubrobacter marinus]QIN77866.1 peptidoglycan DD-metalloendopeptidase family protein [Rubrobacter marinus]
MNTRGRARTPGRYACAMLAAALMALLMIGAASREAAGEPGGTERARDAAVGASVSHPAGWHVEHERYSYDGTYGYTLWRPDSGAEEDHGGTPAARVARVYDVGAGGVDERVRARISAHPDLKIERKDVAVGEEGLRGVALGPIPGSTPSVEVYAEENGSVYQINLYGETLNAEDEKLLSSLRFERPSKSIDSLGLKDGKKAESHYGRGNPEPSKRELEARRAAAAGTTDAPSASTFGAAALAASSVPVYGESQIEEGCWRSASTFFYQTQHGYGANRSANGIATGFTVLGRPNYWGQYTHGSLGYGRCASTYYTNDKFAIDYPLDRGDYVFSPFSGGTVTFAGRNTSHANYGIFVVIRSSNGKYVSMSAHLDSLAAGIRPGAAVTADTVIGYAGDTGDPSIPVGEPHLHQAFYRYPGFKTDGSPYGGQGLQAIYHHYVGTAAGTGPGVYQFGWSKTSTQLTQGDRISN